MSTSVLHNCPFCRHDTDVTTALVGFREDPHCRQCGLSNSEAYLKVQDDLSALFSRQMNMENPVLNSGQQPDDSSGRNLLQFPSSAAHTISQNYLPRRDIQYGVRDQPSQVEMVDVSEVLSTSETLKKHNIEPSSLSLAQLKLFEHAPGDQRLRLIHMWQIVSRNSGHVLPNSPNVSTLTSGSCQSDLNGLANDSWREIGNSPERQYLGTQEVTMDYQDRVDEGMNEFHDAEPYMISGYEALARRDYDVSAEQSVTKPETVATLPVEPTTGSPYSLACDPVFQGRRWWEHTKSQRMEHQYGAFEQRNQFSGCGLVAAHWLRDRADL